MYDTDTMSFQVSRLVCADGLSSVDVAIADLSSAQGTPLAWSSVTLRLAQALSGLLAALRPREAAQSTMLLMLLTT